MCLRTFSATSAGMELECVFFSVTPYPASRSIMALALTSSSRASSFIRTWFTSDMLIKTLPLPTAPLRSCLLRIQPRLHLGFSPLYLARFPSPARSRQLVRSQQPLRALRPRLRVPRRSPLPPLRLLRQRLARSRPLPQAHRYSPPLRLSPP